LSKQISYFLFGLPYQLVHFCGPHMVSYKAISIDIFKNNSLIIFLILASVVFLGDSQPQGKKALAVYPIFLFYFIMSWLVLSHTV